MPPSKNEPPVRGLPAIEEGRRRRARFPKIPPRFWLWMLIVLSAWAIIYWKVTQGQLESWRNRLLSRQRAVASELAPRFVPLRDQLEKWTIEASGPYPGDLFAPDAKSAEFRSKPGVYLRLFIDDAQDLERMRSASTESLRDGFTTCLFTGGNPDPFDGPACKHSRDCPQGQHCNETFHCTVPAQPFNLRVMYRASRVLYDEWVREVRDAGNDMRMRLLERDFDSAVADDIPLGIDLMARSKYFMLVLDEPAANPETVPDAGTASESLQAVTHPVRVFIWDMSTNKLLVRYRDTITADFRSIQLDATGEPSATRPALPGPKASLAVQRQANNCALAMALRQRLGDK